MPQLYMITSKQASTWFYVGDNENVHLVLNPVYSTLYAKPFTLTPQSSQVDNICFTPDNVHDHLCMNGD